jgi:hypothetical protein
MIAKAKSTKSNSSADALVRRAVGNHLGRVALLAILR